MPESSTPRHAWLWILAITAVVAFSFQGTRGLYETTEGRYAQCAKEMWESGNWLVPTLNGRQHWTKPPITYWCISAGYALFGVNEWGVRFYNALTCIGSALLVYWVGANMWNRLTGFLAALIFGTSPFIVVAGNSVSTDGLIALMQTAMIGCYWSAARAATPRNERGWMLALWTVAGLAFLTKGPPAWLVLLATLVFHALQRRNGHAVPRLHWKIGVPWMLLISLSWYITVCLKYEGLLSYYLHDEIYLRVATGHHKRNPEWFKPLTVYYIPLFLGTLPWTLGLFLAWRAVPGEFRRPAMRERFSGRTPWLHLLLWLVIPLTIFSLSKSRLELYVLPLFPVFPLALARAFQRLSAADGLPRRILLLALLFAMFNVTGKYIFSVKFSHQDARTIAASIEEKAGAGTRVFAYNRDEFFGVQFYLDRPLQRVSDPVKSDWQDRSKEEPWADMTLEELLVDIRDTPNGEPCLIVARDHDSATLEKLAAALKLEHETTKIVKRYNGYRFREKRE